MIQEYMLGNSICKQCESPLPPEPTVIKPTNHILVTLATKEADVIARTVLHRMHVKVSDGDFGMMVEIGQDTFPCHRQDRTEIDWVIRAAPPE